MEKEKYIAYVGTYTHGSSIGIHLYDVDVEEGTLSERKVVPVNNSSYVVKSKNGKYLYSIADEGVAVFEIKPDFRGALSTDVNVISRLIGALQQNRNRYRSVVLSGKTTTGERQRQYDLYEEYFKYPISVSEYRQENGQKIEREKAEILRDYRLNMMNVYNEYKDIILAVSNR